jgi:hypothetical protein
LPPPKNSSPRPLVNRKVSWANFRPTPARETMPLARDVTLTSPTKFETGSHRSVTVFSISGDAPAGSTPTSSSNHSASLALEAPLPDRRSSTQRSPRDLTWTDLRGGRGPYHGRPTLEQSCIGVAYRSRSLRPQERRSVVVPLDTAAPTEHSETTASGGTRFEPNL